MLKVLGSTHSTGKTKKETVQGLHGENKYSQSEIVNMQYYFLKICARAKDLQIARFTIAKSVRDEKYRIIL